MSLIEREKMSEICTNKDRLQGAVSDSVFMTKAD